MAKKTNRPPTPESVIAQLKKLGGSADDFREIEGLNYNTNRVALLESWQIEFNGYGVRLTGPNTEEKE